MKRIEVTMEKTLRVCMEFDATEDQIKMLENGINPFENEMEKELETGDIEYDYSAIDVDTGKDIKPWQ